MQLHQPHLVLHFLKFHLLPLNLCFLLLKLPQSLTFGCFEGTLSLLEPPLFLSQLLFFLQQFRLILYERPSHLIQLPLLYCDLSFRFSKFLHLVQHVGLHLHCLVKSISLLDHLIINDALSHVYVVDTAYSSLHVWYWNVLVFVKYCFLCLKLFYVELNVCKLLFNRSGG